MPTISHHFDALFAARWTPEQLSALRMPVRLIVGNASRASARRVAQTLAGLLPNVQAIELDGAGHMAPIADAARVNPLILEHLAQVRG
jgi:pimeloyl-ACP methyl ester carboxylesterase